MAIINLSDMDLSKLAVRYGRVPECANLYYEGLKFGGDIEIKADDPIVDKRCIAGCCYSDRVLEKWDTETVDEIVGSLDSDLECGEGGWSGHYQSCSNEDEAILTQLQEVHDDFVKRHKSIKRRDDFFSLLREYFPDEAEGVIEDILVHYPDSAYNEEGRFDETLIVS